MPVLLQVTKRELPFATAVAKAKTGEPIVICEAPPDPGNTGAYSAHTDGVFSHINGVLRINADFLGDTNNAETHGVEYYSFYKGVLIHKVCGDTQEFVWLFPDGPTPISQGPKVAPLSVKFEKAAFKVLRLCSGKGLAIVQHAPDKQIFLLKRGRFHNIARLIHGHLGYKGVARKPVTEWQGEHATYAESPNSIVVGQVVAENADQTSQTIQFFRGHGKNRQAICEYTGSPNPPIWATNTNFYYLDRRQDAIINAATKLPAYTEYSRYTDDNKGLREFFALDNALVCRQGTVVRTEKEFITDSFVTAWTSPVPHAFGLIYKTKESDQIRLLVIK